MEIPQELNSMINDQINFELLSAYLYLSMANHFQAQSLEGFAHWFFVQWQEEYSHARKFMKFVNERGGKVELMDIKQVKSDFGAAKPIALFEAALKHEIIVTERLKKILVAAREMGDYQSEELMLWYINEQNEEEGNAMEIIDHLRLIGNDGLGLLEYDEELEEREMPLCV